VTVPFRLARAGARGFSLVEVLLALAITLVVMALVGQTMAHVARIYERESKLAVSSSAAALALDDITYELSLVGQGLGEGPAAVVPRRPGSPVASDAMTLRSNPEVRASVLGSDLEEGVDVPVDPSAGFEKGARVLLTDNVGGGETALVVRSESTTIALHPLEENGGSFRRSFLPSRGARVLGLREVRYFLGEPRADGRRDLVKDVVGVGSRVLTGDVLSLGFEYLDAENEPISLSKVESTPELASVRVSLQYLPGVGALLPRRLSTTVALAPRSGAIDFERRDLGFRLSRVFFPIDNPAGVASRIGSRFALILASGKVPSQDPAYLYTFEMEKRFLSASVDDVIFLEDVRAPVSLAFGPEGGPLAGSLFVAAWGLRIGHLSRIAPDASGGIGRDSAVETFDGTDAIAQAGGIAFGADNALYVASQEKGAMFRFRFGPQGKPGNPERLFRLTGAPGAMVEGTDGHLYFLMNHGETGSLWRMEFDETLTPQEPVRVGALPGFAVSLSRDPVSGDLFALLRDPTADFVVLELGRRFLKGLQDPTPLFSLRAWRGGLLDVKTDPRDLPFAIQGVEALPSLEIEELDFLSFDSFGSLYMGCRKASLVLKFELDRPSGRYVVGLAAGVVERGPDLTPAVRMHAWKKTVF
jgi:prepilin-type N-terminal cleavage/methylation domain-containing protein